MLISILTLFPEIFTPFINYSILKRAIKADKISLNIINIRDFGLGERRTVDDRPYGGGAGMILRVDVLEKAIQSSRKNIPREKIVLLDPKGSIFNQKTAQKYSQLDHLILVCGHYEGVDGRIYDYIDESVSIGKFILTGGELAAAVITDSVARLTPDILNPSSLNNESFSQSLKQFESLQYTRPPIYNNSKVPEILLSGNHKEILKFQKRI